VESYDGQVDTVLDCSDGQLGGIGIVCHRHICHVAGHLVVAVDHKSTYTIGMMNNNTTTKQVGNVTIHSNPWVTFAFEVHGHMFKINEGVDIIDPQTGLKSVQGTIDYICDSGFSARILGPFGSGSPFQSFDAAAKFGSAADDNASWKQCHRSCPVGLI
jgi:hypothetical protein